MLSTNSWFLWYNFQGAIVTIGKEYDIDDETMIDALFTASAIGAIITRNATVSGAEGGCQAETGAAAAMRISWYS